MTADDALLRALDRLAWRVLRESCRGSHWLGLERSDLVSAGWLSYQRVQDAPDTRAETSRAYGLAAAYHAMRREALDWMGYRKRNNTVCIQLEPEHLPSTPACDVDDEDVTTDWRDHAILLFEKLDDEARDILHRFYIEQQSPQEIATARQCPVSRVYKRRYTAVETLRVLAGNASAARERERARSLAWQHANRDRMRETHRRYEQTRRIASYFVWIAPLATTWRYALQMLTAIPSFG